jgi:hypothetical protein
LRGWPTQETTPAKSALEGIPHHTTRRRRRLQPPRRTMMNAPARALSFRSWRSPPTVRRATVASDRTARWRTEKRRSNGPSDSHSAHVDSVVCTAFRAAICAEIGMTRLRRRIDECAGLEVVGYRLGYGKIKAAVPRVSKPLTWLSFLRAAGRSAVPLEGKKLDFSRPFSTPAIQQYQRNP